MRVIRGFPEYTAQFGSGGYSDRLHLLFGVLHSHQHKTMDPPQMLLCHEGVMIFVPRPEECAVPVEEWPRPLQFYSGSLKVHGKWNVLGTNKGSYYLLRR